MGIETPADLRQHLQWAIEVELATIPPYLYAMYALEDRHSVAYGLIRSVAVEEMLHVAIAANLLSAVGGEPRLDDPSVVPSYPTPLPHHRPTLTLHLQEPSLEVIESTFLTIEQPARVESQPEDDDFETLGQFYLAIEDALERLDAEYPLFDAGREEMAAATNRAYQLANPGYYRPVEYDSVTSGGLRPIEDLADAERAVETIIHQGEGLRDHRYADPDHKELTHYYKFKRIADGEVRLGATRPVVRNPSRSDVGPELRPVATLFDASYTYLLGLLEELFQPLEESTENRMVSDLYALMNDVLRPIARKLTATPVREGADRTAGPPFGYYRFERDAGRLAEIQELADAAVAAEPALASVAETTAELSDWSVTT